MTELARLDGKGTLADLPSQEFLERVEQIKDSIYKKRKEESAKETPKHARRKFGEKRPKLKWSDIEYVEEDYLRDLLTRDFIWSWEGCGTQPLQIHERIGHISFTGTLSIFDNGVWRKFTACGGSAIKVKSGTVPSYDTIVNFGNDTSAANTMALKKAINMLCNYADDVYQKNVPAPETPPELLEQMTNLFNQLKEPERQASIHEYINETYGSWKSIDTAACHSIITNLKEHIKYEERNINKGDQANG